VRGEQGRDGLVAFFSPFAKNKTASGRAQLTILDVVRIGSISNRTPLLLLFTLFGCYRYVVGVVYSRLNSYIATVG
jgi:hypothetical protein